MKTLIIASSVFLSSLVLGCAGEVFTNDPPPPADAAAPPVVIHEFGSLCNRVHYNEDGSSVWSAQNEYPELTQQEIAARVTVTGRGSTAIPSGDDRSLDAVIDGHTISVKCADEGADFAYHGFIEVTFTLADASAPAPAAARHDYLVMCADGVAVQPFPGRGAEALSHEVVAYSVGKGPACAQLPIVTDDAAYFDCAAARATQIVFSWVSR